MSIKISGVADIDLLQILRNTPDALRVRYFANQQDPEGDFDPGDCEPSTFDGTEQVEITNPGWNLPEDFEDGLAEIVSNMTAATMVEGADPQTVWGYTLVLIHDNLEYLVGAEQFDVGIEMAAAGDKIERAFKLNLAEFELAAA